MMIARFPPTIGGAEIQCYRLSTWLAQHGHAVVVLTEQSAPGQLSYERINDFDVIRFSTWGKPPFSSFLYGLQVLWYLFSHPRFDILHAHMISSPAMAASLAGFLRRTPVLIKVAGGRKTGDFSTSRAYPLGRFKLWSMIRGNPYVVCPSPETFQEAESFGIRKEKLSYIPNGVDTTIFKPAPNLKSQLRMAHQWPGNAPVAIYVGRWAKGKGVESLLDLWEAGVSRSEFPWHLALLLSEPVTEAIGRRIQNLKERIHAVFGVTDTPPYYQAADIAVLLSEGEGLSNFLLEAMACGIPTMTTAAAALPDADGEKIGTFTLPTDTPALQGALDFLMGEARQDTRLPMWGIAAREHIEKNYSLAKIGIAYTALYEKMNG